MQFRAHHVRVSERDVNEEASRLVNEVTDSEPVNDHEDSHRIFDV
jgi:hypothetical protein